MNDIDHILCASPASAPMCLNMDHISSPSSSTSTSTSTSTTTARLGGRAIDRHNPIIRDGRRSTVPLQNTRNGSPSGGNYSTPKKQNNNKKCSPKGKKPSGGDGGKSPADDFITPPGSSRYLLGDPVFFDGLSDSDPVPIPIEEIEDSKKTDEVIDFDEDRLIINASKMHSSSSSSSSSSFLEQKQPPFSDRLPDYDPVLSLDNPTDGPNKTPQEAQNQNEDKQANASKQSSSFFFSEKKPSSDQVVVLRVSLHCKGCAGKVKKHLSRMQGVTSFNIDFAAKKVTVTGDVTPLGVLASISKVKNAQFWTDIKN